VFVPYEATQGRRVNAIGAYFSHGPQAGRLEFETCASLPKNRAKKSPDYKPRLTPEQSAAKHGLRASDVGIFNAERLLAFVWRLAGRPADAAANWRRECPLVVVLDNYSVHQSQTVQEEKSAWESAGVTLFFLPSYSPELSEIEPIWHALKHYQLTCRSYAVLGDLKAAVDAALGRKAEGLREAHAKTEYLLQTNT
jgi:hypothetical protein